MFAEDLPHVRTRLGDGPVPGWPFPGGKDEVLSETGVIKRRDAGKAAK